jgi:hypothetical protein
MDNRDLLFSALMGSRSFQTIKNLNLVQDDLLNKGLPLIPYLRNRKQPDSIQENQQYFPLSFSFTDSGQKWLFPFEPIINISSGNNIIERNVAKNQTTILNNKDNLQFGTIKERWSRKDIEISITGVLMGSILKGSPDECFPKKQMQALLEFLTTCGAIYVYSHPLLIMGITKLVIYDYSFPFTKGENVQAYEIKAKSDTSYNLLIKEPF